MTKEELKARIENVAEKAEFVWWDKERDNRFAFGVMPVPHNENLYMYGELNYTFEHNAWAFVWPEFGDIDTVVFEMKNFWEEYLGLPYMAERKEFENYSVDELYGKMDADFESEKGLRIEWSEEDSDIR